MYAFHALPVPDFAPSVHEGLARYLLDPWQHWDGQWFLRIAQRGYYPDDASAAFLPLYPRLIRYVAEILGGDHLAAGCLVSWVCLAGALYLLADLLYSELDEEDARNALVLLVTFPTAFFFHAVYTESLFLLLTVASFRWARRGEFLLAGTAALFATLTRWTGVALVPALAAEAMAQAHERARAEGGPPKLRDLLSRAGLSSLRGADKGALLAALMPAAALPMVLYELDRRVGDAWAFSRAQRLWERRLTPPWTGLIDGVRVLLPGNPPYLDPLPGGFPRLADYPGGFLTAHTYNLIAALVGLALCAVAWRRLRAPYAVWALGGVLIPLMTPSKLQPLQSMPRFLVVVFPLFLALAVLLRGRPLLLACAIATGACIQGFFAARFVLWYWVA